MKTAALLLLSCLGGENRVQTSQTKPQKPASGTEVAQKSVRYFDPKKLDVNNDGIVSPIDGMIIINEVNRQACEENPMGVMPVRPRTERLDTNEDGFVSGPEDVCPIFDYLNNGVSHERFPKISAHSCNDVVIHISRPAPSTPLPPTLAAISLNPIRNLSPNAPESDEKSIAKA